MQTTGTAGGYDFMLRFSASLSFSESLRGMFSALRALVVRPGAGSPTQLESASNHLMSNDHPLSADVPAGMPDAEIQKHLLVRNIL